MVMEKLIGKTIKRIFIDSDYLQFLTDDGAITYCVEGDCCSSSVFNDFIGVKNLLGNKVLSVESIYLNDKEERNEQYDVVQFYGYRLTTKNPKFGEVSSVVSFRNHSNGYYGGWMEECGGDVVVKEEIFDDVTKVEDHE